MQDNPRLENALNPITALAFVKLDRVFLVAGEGQYVKLFDLQTETLLSKHCIFKSEAIHGVACSVDIDKAQPTSARLLVWGGHSLCLAELSSQRSATAPPLSFNILLPEVTTDEWILDGCLEPVAIENDIRSVVPLEAVFLTTLNELRRLRLPENILHATQNSLNPRKPVLHTIDRLGSGPKSVLYSAHVRWSREDLAKGRVLIAAGTVLGEVHLWSVQRDQISNLRESQLHCTFTGHQSSVFGVQISERVSPITGSRTLLLASCSDDRMIRTWDISDLMTPSPVDPISHCFAMTMAHASRIWAVRFLNGQNGLPQLMSFGEDGTAQAWRLEPKSKNEKWNELEVNEPFILVHNTAYHYHSGKHIWAVAVLEDRFGSSLIATGGSDGRVVSYCRTLPNSEAPMETISIHSTMNQIAEPSKQADKYSDTAIGKLIFNALKGKWLLSRTLQSAIPIYPSGTLSGSAEFEERPSTDLAFNDECLYSEEGNFVTDKGFKMRATRQYAYRYQQKDDRLTAWFIKTEGQGIVDYLFHCLEISGDARDRAKEVSDKDAIILTASGHHICINDDYTAEYKFTFLNQRLNEWSVKYTVKGPQKDYVADAKYSRPLPVDEDIPSDVPWKHSLDIEDELPKRQPKTDAFKAYAWVSNSEVVTVTEHGNILVGTLTADSTAPKSNTKNIMLAWEVVYGNSELTSSAISTSIPSLGTVFLIGKSGKVFLYHSKTKKVEIIAAGRQKPVYVKAQEIDPELAASVTDDYGSWRILSSPERLPQSRRWVSLIVASLSSDIVVISLHSTDMNGSLGDYLELTCQMPKGFVTTSSCVLEKATLVIFGSRNGNLLIYDPLRKFCEVGTSPSESVFPGIHGQETITDIQVLPDRSSPFDPGTSWILTVGRDGRFAVHSIRFFEMRRRNRKPELTTHYESSLPFGPWIQGAYFDSTNNDLFLWGFRSKRFVVWNETQKIEVMSVDCGGAHRHWAYLPLDDGGGGGSFVWTKASICNVHRQDKASHKLLQAGGHGREIKAVAVTAQWKQHDGPGRRIIATGAEDTAIRIFEYDTGSDYGCKSVIRKHITGVQKLRWSGQYLLSAAGGEEFFIWEITPVPVLGLGTKCLLSCPKVTPDGDLRIMDFGVLDVRVTAPAAIEEISSVQLIGIVYSDSSVRIFAFRKASYGDYSLTLILEGAYTTTCLTLVTFITFNSAIYLCTASTDGNLAFWSLKIALGEHGFHLAEDLSVFFDPGRRSERPMKTFSWQKQIPVHQNSIKSLVQVSLSPKDCLILTGGDDQALALNLITAQDSSLTDNPHHTILLLPNAHASAVTAVAFLDHTRIGTQMTYRFASVGNDQRLKIWEIVDSMHGEGVERFAIRKRASVHTSVADASALEAFAGRVGEPKRLCVVGIGMETWCVDRGILIPEEE